MCPKADAEEIVDHMSGLASSLRLDPARRWWPRWLFRSDHVENAARILNSGKLFSRWFAARNGLIVKDSGSPLYVSGLDDEQLRYVRLYFRPRTPTNFANEGVRPQHKIEYEAHMPVPVYLLFAANLLAEKGISFTHGRLEMFSDIGASVDFLRSMDFRDVYHDAGVGYRGDTRRRAILNARHSEVLAKDALSLRQLKRVVCRSHPERETLLTLLDSTARSKWIDRIIVDAGNLGLFHRRGTYVQDVSLSHSDSRFVFFADRPEHWRGPFELRIKWESGSWRGVVRRSGFTVPSRPMRFKLPDPMISYTVKMYLDSDLVYSGEFREHGAFDLPF